MKWIVCALAAGFANLAGAQGDTLTLDQALKLAKERNGTVRSAYLNSKAADARVKQAFAAFLPTVTPSFVYKDARNDVYTGATKGWAEAVTNTSGIVANWQLLDSGERGWAFSASKASDEATRFDYLQTLRETLFSVQKQYFDTLRAQELLKVADGQVKRTEEVLKQTKDFAETGQGAKINISQANADFQNARVQALVAKNTVSTAEAGLKAVIGWDKDDDLPALVTQPEPASFDKLPPLAQVIKDGLRERADLSAQRKRVAAERYSVLRAEREASFTWSLDAAYGRNFSDDVMENRSVTFMISLPLFDGERSKQAARESRLGWESAKSALLQTERAARAEIEASYRDLQQNADRVAAAKSALDAAKENYTATNESFALGASTLIDVLTAQVTLQTAESNYIQAVYDYYISEVQLKLATGQPLPGEDEAR
jgi:outer membrane protein